MRELNGSLPVYLTRAHKQTRKLANQLVHRARFGTISEHRMALVRHCREQPSHAADLITMLSWLAAKLSYPETLTEIQAYEAWMSRMHAEFWATPAKERTDEMRVGEAAYSQTKKAISGYLEKRRRARKRKEEEAA